MTQEEHVWILAEEQQMTAARTKQHEEEKNTGIRTDKKQEMKEARQKKQENRTQGADSNKAFRLCHKAEPGTLSHYSICHLFPAVVDRSVKCHY